MALSLLLFLFLFQSAFAQEESRNWNIGISEGFGGVHYFFFPSIDFSYKRHTFRVSPMLPAQSFAYQIEMLHLIEKSTESLDLIASLAYTHSNDLWQIPVGKGERIWFIPTNRLSLLTGIRYDFGKRMTLGIMLGAALQKIRDTGNLAVYERLELQLKPGFEASFGVRLFQNRYTTP